MLRGTRARCRSGRESRYCQVNSGDTTRHGTRATSEAELSRILEGAIEEHIGDSHRPELVDEDFRVIHELCAPCFVPVPRRSAGPVHEERIPQLVERHLVFARRKQASRIEAVGQSHRCGNAMRRIRKVVALTIMLRLSLNSRNPAAQRDERQGGSAPGHSLPRSPRDAVSNSLASPCSYSADRGISSSAAISRTSRALS